MIERDHPALLIGAQWRPARRSRARRSNAILVNASGRAWKAHRASEGLRQWRDKAGLTPMVLGCDLRLQDARGTAATRLLNAGLTLAEIASHMGWSVRHAAAVIEHYARVLPEESDAVLVKLARAQKGTSGTKL